MTTTTPEVIGPEHYADQDEEGRVTETADLGALVQINSAEIGQQIMTARAYPRSITGFRKNMREMVTLDEEVAQSCLYALKRGGKVIEGPSARFAEVAAQMWGNCRAGARVIDIGEEYVTAQGAFYDLEKNVAVSYEVLRRITDREGNKFNADMIGVTGNAACSIAIRNAILKGVPKAFWGDAYQQAREVAFGKGETIANKRVKAIQAFQPYGIEPAQIYGLLGVAGPDDITINHLVLLGGIHTAIKEGETTPEEAFSVSNMPNSKQATPPRPKQSEFTRQEPKKEAPKQEAHGQPATAPQQQQASAEPQGGLPDQLTEWLGDRRKELEGLVRVRDVADLYDSVIEQIGLDDPRAKEWETLCQAKQRAVLDTTAKNKKR